MVVEVEVAGRWCWRAPGSCGDSGTVVAVAVAKVVTVVNCMQNCSNVGGSAILFNFVGV